MRIRVKAEKYEDWQVFEDILPKGHIISKSYNDGYHIIEVEGLGISEDLILDFYGYKSEIEEE